MEITRTLDRPLGPAAVAGVRRWCSREAVIGLQHVRLYCHRNDADAVCRVLASVCSKVGPAQNPERRGAAVPMTGGTDLPPEDELLALGRRAHKRRNRGENEDPSEETVKAVRDYLRTHRGASYDAIVRDLGIGWATAIACVHRLGDLRGREQA